MRQIEYNTGQKADYVKTGDEWMNHCPTCTECIYTARIVCAGCGEALPLRLVVVSEGSQGGGFALAREVSVGENADHDLQGKADGDWQRERVEQRGKEKSL